jgi:hypothetical protein
MVIRREKYSGVKDVTRPLPQGSTSHIEVASESGKFTVSDVSHLNQPEEAFPDEAGARERKTVRVALWISSFAALTATTSTFVTVFIAYTGLLG